MSNGNLKINEQAPGSRDFLYDNLKLFLIWAVIFGHSLEPLLGSSDAANYLYTFIYIFHMPAFVFTVGYFYKKIPRNLMKKISLYLLLFIIFQTIYSLFLDRPIQFFVPVWPLWFLVGLISWLAIGSLLPANKKVIAAALFFSLAIGGFSLFGEKYSLARTFYFLPFFLAGTYFKKFNILKIFRLKPPSAVIAAFIFISAIIIVYYFNFDPRWLYGKYHYAFFDFNFLSGAVYRLLTYLASFIMIACLIILTPRTKNIISFLGRNTLAVYLLHGFFVRLDILGFRKTDDVALLLFQAFYSIIILLGLGLAIAFIKKTTAWCIPLFKTKIVN